MVLTDLDDTDWSGLSHAYGDASDTPWHLQRLLSPSSATRRGALTALSHSVYHQSGGYSASAPAMEHLLKLLAEPEVRQKAGILALVSELGHTQGSYHTIGTGHVDPRPWLSRWYGADDSTSLEDFLACERLFAAHTGLFAGLLHDREAGVRTQAAFALAWIPSSAAASIAALLKAVVVERNLRARLSMELALGVLSLAEGAPRAELRAWRDAPAATRCQRLAPGHTHGAGAVPVRRGARRVAPAGGGGGAAGVGVGLSAAVVLGRAGAARAVRARGAGVGAGLVARRVVRGGAEVRAGGGPAGCGRAWRRAGRR